MIDAPKWFHPTFKIPERQPTPGELIWSLRKDQETLTCELRNHGEFGWETQTFRNGELHLGTRFDSRDLAVQFANVLRGDFERGGWVVQKDKP